MNSSIISQVTRPLVTGPPSIKDGRGRAVQKARDEKQLERARQGNAFGGSARRTLFQTGGRPQLSD